MQMEPARDFALEAKVKVLVNLSVSEWVSLLLMRLLVGVAVVVEACCGQVALLLLLSTGCDPTSGPKPSSPPLQLQAMPRVTIICVACLLHVCVRAYVRTCARACVVRMPAMAGNAT
jgi:hypothetical protein